MNDFKYTRLARPDSSAIDLVAYDDADERLLIRFKKSNDVYVYDEVPDFEYDAMLVGDGHFGSVGRYYQAEIMGTYNSEKVTSSIDLEERVRDIRSAPSVRDVSSSETVKAQPVDPIAQSLALANQEYTKYGVQYAILNTLIVAEATYQAKDETDALAQLYAALALTLPGVDVKVMAVTHYFD